MGWAPGEHRRGREGSLSKHVLDRHWLPHSYLALKPGEPLPRAGKVGWRLVRRLDSEVWFHHFKWFLVLKVSYKVFEKSEHTVAIPTRIRAGQDDGLSRGSEAPLNYAEWESLCLPQGLGKGYFDGHTCSGERRIIGERHLLFF